MRLLHNLELITETHHPAGVAYRGWYIRNHITHRFSDGAPGHSFEVSADGSDWVVVRSYDRPEFDADSRAVDLARLAIEWGLHDIARHLALSYLPTAEAQAILSACKSKQ